MLNMVALVKPVAGMENRNERRYISGSIAHPYSRNTRTKRPCCSPEMNPSSWKHRNVTRIPAHGIKKLTKSHVMFASQNVAKCTPETN